MAGIFLTEGHRIQPRFKRRVKPQHPWNKGLNLRSGVTMPTGPLGGEAMQPNHIPGTQGCYHTAPTAGDQ